MELPGGVTTNNDSEDEDSKHLPRLTGEYPESVDFEP